MYKCECCGEDILNGETYYSICDQIFCKSCMTYAQREAEYGPDPDEAYDRRREEQLWGAF